MAQSTSEEAGRKLQLLAACKQNDLITVQKLINDGVDVNVTDSVGWSALQHACYLSHETIAMLLLRSPLMKADHKASDGSRALHFAASNCGANIVNAVLLKKGSPNAVDNSQMTPLFMAVGANKVDNVRALLSSPQTEVNHTNILGGTALHHTAYKTDNVEIAQLLVSAGVDIDLKDDQSRTALDEARRYNRERLTTYLSALQSDPSRIGHRTDSLDKDLGLFFSADMPPPANDQFYDDSKPPQYSTMANWAQFTAANPSQPQPLIQPKRTKEDPSSFELPTSKPLQSSSNSDNDSMPIQSEVVKQPLSSELEHRKKPMIEELMAENQRLRLKNRELTSQLTEATVKITESKVTMTKLIQKLRNERKAQLLLSNRYDSESEQSHVQNWLCNEVGLPQYLELFVKNGFDDMRAMKHLNHSELTNIGVSKRGHRLRILTGVPIDKTESEAHPQIEGKPFSG